MDSIPLSSLLDRLNGHCLQGDVDPNQLLRGTSSVVHGKGKYRFPSGLIYEGEFQDSMFDGEGTLFFPNDGGRFVGAWKRGKLVHGKYFFQDNLEYRPENWQYCTDGDRRFWTEIQNGIRIADAPALSDKEYVNCVLCAEQCGRECRQVRFDCTFPTSPSLIPFVSLTSLPFFPRLQTHALDSSQLLGSWQRIL